MRPSAPRSSAPSGASLVAELGRLQSLSAGGLLVKLPDGGERVSRRIAAIQQQLAALHTHATEQRTDDKRTERREGEERRGAEHTRDRPLAAAAAGNALCAPVHADSSLSGGGDGGHSNNGISGSGSGDAASRRPHTIRVALDETAAALRAEQARPSNGRQPRGHNTTAAARRHTRSHAVAAVCAHTVVASSCELCCAWTPPRASCECAGRTADGASLSTSARSTAPVEPSSDGMTPTTHCTQQQPPHHSDAKLHSHRPIHRCDHTCCSLLSLSAARCVLRVRVAGSLSFGRSVRLAVAQRLG